MRPGFGPAARAATGNGKASQTVAPGPDTNFQRRWAKISRRHKQSRVFTGPVSGSSAVLLRRGHRVFEIAEEISFRIWYQSMRPQKPLPGQRRTFVARRSPKVTKCCPAISKPPRSPRKNGLSASTGRSHFHTCRSPSKRNWWQTKSCRQHRLRDNDCARYPSNGSFTMIVSSRSGLVDSNVTGASTSSSIRRTYFTA